MQNLNYVSCKLLREERKSLCAGMFCVKLTFIWQLDVIEARMCGISYSKSVTTRCMSICNAG